MILEKDSIEIILTPYVPDTTIKQEIDQITMEVISTGSSCSNYSLILTQDNIRIHLNDSSIVIQNELSTSLINEFEQIDLSKLENNYTDPIV